MSADEPDRLGCMHGALQVSVAATCTSGAVPKMYARVSSPTDMPAEPSSSSGRRPKRSIARMATTVAAMLMPPLITEICSELLSVKPTACHRMLE